MKQFLMIYTTCFYILLPFLFLIPLFPLPLVLFRVAALLSLLVVRHLPLLLIFFHWFEFSEAKGEMRTCCVQIFTHDVCLGVDADTE